MSGQTLRASVGLFWLQGHCPSRPGQTVNQHSYWEVFKHLREQVHQKRSKLWWALVDSPSKCASKHCSNTAAVVLHPPYSHNLTSCNFSFSQEWNCHYEGPFQGYLWYSGKIADHPVSDFKVSSNSASSNDGKNGPFHKLRRGQLQSGQQTPRTKISVYFNSVCQLLDMASNKSLVKMG
jgi:hypothetical protein